MKVTQFRISNFRSISDTGWRKFSPDNVTVLVGQNESGKTSILEALAASLGDMKVTDDDIRTDGTSPKVELQLEIDKEDLASLSKYLVEEEACDEDHVTSVCKRIGKLNAPFGLVFEWSLNPEASSDKDVAKYVCDNRIANLDLDEIIAVDQSSVGGPSVKEDESPSEDGDTSEVVTEVEKPISGQEASATTSKKHPVTASVLVDGVYQIAPFFAYFNHSEGLLPSRIDITKNKYGYTLTGEGSKAANNFLAVAGLKLKDLVEGSERQSESLLVKANSEISKDFTSFWSQTIGDGEQLKLECNLKAHAAESGEKSGAPYLAFWINDGSENKLYPKQRSQGVRWFTAFYLELRASKSRRWAHQRWFLLDEPGANLHSKAQTDVLKLVDELSSDIPIVYSTHTPHMVEYDKLYRVLAVQRMGENINNPTQIIPALELGTASTDTLSPVLTAMGVDLSNQEVIKKSNNVILEEMSGFFYLTAFWKLVGEKQDAHFIAATGVNKIPNFANMFMGWGLEFIVVVDDDSAGRKVYNELKKSIFADDDELAKKHMYKVRSCDGIEDIFSPTDFKKHLLKDVESELKEANSQAVKKMKLSKPLLAHTFLQEVRKGSIKMESFDKATKENIQSLVDEIKTRLAN